MRHLLLVTFAAFVGFSVVAGADTVSPSQFDVSRFDGHYLLTKRVRGKCQPEIYVGGYMKWSDDLRDHQVGMIRVVTQMPNHCTTNLISTEPYFCTGASYYDDVGDNLVAKFRDYNEYTNYSDGCGILASTIGRMFIGDQCLRDDNYYVSRLNSITNRYSWHYPGTLDSQGYSYVGVSWIQKTKDGLYLDVSNTNRSFKCKYKQVAN